ncbi:hypothetical protein SS50377_22355 [Spironucleus salmonicida]|uniref:Uncharacterized protein n=1 Tax=Spironucleus salmonicida TaxID=348837 RepID=V6LCC2_9EUKA|nr:hypothetical protein SS50377_22355 [Spironucleus salmonicida]|eukprot:EST42150.1 Hypothetical protein SS50377_ee012 [Spironucleus salmonicida]
MEKLLSKLFYSYFDQSYILSDVNIQSASYQLLMAQRLQLQKPLSILTKIQKKLCILKITEQISSLVMNYKQIKYFEDELVKFVSKNISGDTLYQIFYLYDQISLYNKVKLFNKLYQYHQNVPTVLSFYLVFSAILEILQFPALSQSQQLLLNNILKSNLSGYEYIENQVLSFINNPLNFTYKAQQKLADQCNSMPQLTSYETKCKLKIIPKCYQLNFEISNLSVNWFNLNQNYEHQFNPDNIQFLQLYQYYLNQAKFYCYKHSQFCIEEHVKIQRWQTKKIY